MPNDSIIKDIGMVTDIPAMAAAPTTCPMNILSMII
jgi:hypothetical protein